MPAEGRQGEAGDVEVVLTLSCLPRNAKLSFAGIKTRALSRF